MLSRVSADFVAALIAIGLTVASWLHASFAWASWPAFTFLNLVFGNGEAWVELPKLQHDAMFCVLLVINVGFWTVLQMILIRLDRHFFGGK